MDQLFKSKSFGFADERLQSEQVNFENATDMIDRTLKIIENDIVNNGKGRGGQKGMHGFIAEVAECGIGNARSQIAGKAPVYEWINDNGPEDLKRAGILIQQKFVQAGNHLSLQAIQKHLEKYPSFIKNGGVYQIPADHYQKIEWLRSIPEVKQIRWQQQMVHFHLSSGERFMIFCEREGSIYVNRTICFRL